MTAASSSLRAIVVIAAIAISPATSHAQSTERVGVTVEDRQAWTGQRIKMQVELRSRASFGGATSFYPPDVPMTLIMNVGNPVVSSKTIDGEFWAVQIHELDIFSQADGKLEIPEFTVRFGARDEYTGPLQTIDATVPAQAFHINRPPGSEALGFVVTTETLEIHESWESEPAPAKPGDVIKRTVTQTAAGLPGMALAPLPTGAPDGVRVYSSPPRVSDDTERGAFTGEREETLTYKLQQPGTVTLPAIQFVWWNPVSERLLTKTLPSVSIDVAAPPPAESPPTTREVPWGSMKLVMLAVLAVLVVLSQRARLARIVRSVEQRLHPPERVARRSLLRACTRDDPAAAERAWLDWSTLVPLSAGDVPTDLAKAVSVLERHLYGAEATGEWYGDALGRAVRRFAEHAQDRGKRSGPGALPALNAPTGPA